MKNTFFGIAQTLLVLTGLLFSNMSTQAAPYGPNGRVVQYVQPDESLLPVRLFGDEFYAVEETLDGYTIVRDHATGFMCYARLSADGTEFVSSGVRADAGQPPAGLAKKIRITVASREAKAAAARTRFGKDAKGRLLPNQREQLRPRAAAQINNAPGIQFAPPAQQTVGTRVGLTLLARFPDRLADVTVTQAQVDAYCNDPEYNGFGNATSIYGYFHLQSNGKLKYNNVVSAYFTAAQPRAYYTDRNVDIGTRARELIAEGLVALNNAGFDFSDCDGDGDGVLDGVNLFYAGNVVNNWSEGLWPHQWSSRWDGLVDHGMNRNFQYQITDMSQQIDLGTFCHENGHMICDFPDLYSYNGNPADMGTYSLMHSSGGTHPVNVDPYLKRMAGWAETIDIDANSHHSCTVQAGRNTFYRYVNPANAREYFLIEMRGPYGYEGNYRGTAACNPAHGLVVYHVNENGSNTRSTIVTGANPVNYGTPFELMLVEATPSGTVPWYSNPSPNAQDAFWSGGVNALSNDTRPELRFWSNQGRTVNSNLNIHTISDRGATMTFIVGNGALVDAPSIGATTSAITATTDFGVNAASMTFAVFNKGGGTLNYAINDNVAWLNTDVANGSAQREADVITVNFATANLASGVHNGSITIRNTANQAQLVIPVTLTVNARPTVALTPSPINVVLNQGQSATRTLELRNTGGGTMTYALVENAAWLTLNTAGGTCAKEVDLIEATFNGAIAPGNYNTTIQVNSASATNAPLVVNVTFTVNSMEATIAASDSSANETAGNTGAFRVTLPRAATVATTVNYSVSGTAVAADFAALTGSLSIPAGQTTGTVTLTPVDDAIYEGDETVILTLTGVSGYLIGSPSTATVTITENESAPVATIAATDNSATEAAGNTGVFTVTLSRASSKATTVNFSASGTAVAADYAALGGSVSIAAGQTTGTVTVTPVDDNIFEGNETVILTLSNGTGYTVGSTNAATVTITDNDSAPTATIAATDNAATEASGNTGVFTVTLSRASSNATTVNFTASGTAVAADYTALGGSVSVPAGQTTRTVTVTPGDDNIFEGNETVILTLNNGTGYTVGSPSNATVTITDNDSAPTATIAATDSGATETAGNTGTFTVTLSRVSSKATVVNFTASGTAVAADYAALGANVSIAAGQTTGTISVSPVNDGVFEGPETVILTLGTGTGYTVGTAKTATVTISDTNALPTVISSTYTIIEGATLTETLQASDTDGQSLTFQIATPPTLGAVNLDSATGVFTYTPNAGAVGADTFTVRASDGFDLSAPATISVNVQRALSVLSGPSAMPNPAVAGQAVQFSVAGSTAAVWTWDMGDGTVGLKGDAASYAFAAPGVYVVAVQGADAFGQSVSASVTVTVLAPALPGDDSDNDGVNNENEGLDGTDPNSPGSFLRIPMQVTKFAAGLKFNKANSDGYAFSGVLPNLPTTFNAANAPITLRVNGVEHRFTLDEKGKGRAKAAFGSLGLKLKYGKKDKATRLAPFLGGDGAIKVKVSRAELAAAWGLSPQETVSAVTKPVSIDVFVNGRVYGVDLQTLFSSKAGKGGKLKR